MEAAPKVLTLAEAARLPQTGDNAAIAVRRLEAGTRVLINHLVFELSHTVLEGHRFAVHRINKGEPIRSWGLPFGMALRPIEPGEYLCNEKILGALGDRRVGFELPGVANFADYRLDYRLDERNFRAGEPVARKEVRFFMGYPRGGGRGVGTRNFVVVLGTSARTGPFARELAGRFADGKYGAVDGVVAVDHTEGGGNEKPANWEMTLRTLAGFMVHPNAAAVLAVDFGSEAVNNGALREWMTANGYPIGDVRHEFMSVGGFEESLRRGERILKGWLEEAGRAERVECSVEHLKLGLQCGGSDAFSGISANPLLGILARKVIARGGSANLAETSELIGAESYVLAQARNVEVARKFLETQRRFEEWAAAHGHSAEGNPSGGNMFRGLYNITVKSIGAARKKDPETRLDYVVDYGERMREAGFYFMDSPGNDLESIAGQVASGCNVILFATGNGSITNFPFVPTVKVMTTTARFELLRKEMDFNAGRYLDGEDLEALGQEAFEGVLRWASGEATAGERAGHSQVQLWREWRGGERREAAEGARIFEYGGKEIPAELAEAAFGEGVARERIALVLPTSLCAGEVARMIARRLNEGLPEGIDRAAFLPHTEGCGNSIGAPEEMFMRTMIGYLRHPAVGSALLLEHGCEKTHNDAFEKMLRRSGLDRGEFGWASVQMDGGIEKVVRKAAEWFGRGRVKGAATGPFGIGFAGRGFPEVVARALAGVIEAALGRGARVIVPEDFPEIGREEKRLRYGERADGAGLYRMELPTRDAVEEITGLGACGAEVIVAYDEVGLVPSNPVVPVVQLGGRMDADVVVQEVGRTGSAGALDHQGLIFEGGETGSAGASPHREEGEIAERIVEKILAVRRGERTRAGSAGNVAFQVTRGYSGISL